VYLKVVRDPFHYEILKPRRKHLKIGYGYLWDPNVLFWYTRIILCHNYFV